MSTALPSGFEISIVVAAALTLAAAAMWVNSKVSLLLGRTPLKRPAQPQSRLPHRLTRTDRPVRRNEPSQWFAGVSADASRFIRSISPALNRFWQRGAARKAAAPARARIKRSAAAAAQRIPVAVPAPRLTAQAQWDRTARTVGQAVLGAQAIRTAHSAAAEKLDAAGYAIDKLVAELEGIMSLKMPPAEIALFPGGQQVLSLPEAAPARARVAA